MRLTPVLFLTLASLVACGGDSDDPAPASAAGSSPGGSGGSGPGGSGPGGSGGSAQAGSTGQAGSGDAGQGGQGGDQGGAGTAGSAGSGATGKLFACPGGTIAPGLNKDFMVGEKKRSFYADFPDDTSTPLPVIFSWHGYGDTAANFHDFGPEPTTDPAFPFIKITPEDLNLFPPAGLDWDLFEAAQGTENDDGALFEAVIGCLSEQYSVDSERIYSMGFSAGAIMTNLLHARYPKVMAATLAFSGAWFNDADETSSINTLGIKVNFDWSPLDPAEGGIVMITHGGPNDSFGQFGTKVIDFETSAQSAIPFLAAGGRAVIECTHTKGHTPAPDVKDKHIIQYFSAHRAGQPSPYKTDGLPSDFPSSCVLKLP